MFVIMMFALSPVIVLQSQKPAENNGAPARMRAATLMGKMAIGHLINRFGKGPALAVPPGLAEEQGL